MEPATVSHFNVDVCTGCRAFFRRSKEQLYNQKLDNPTQKISTTSSSTTVSLITNEPLTTILSFPSNTTTPADSVMEHFLHFRRKITYDRLQTYYGKNKIGEDVFVDCNHTVGSGLRESHLIVEILSRSPVFDGIPAADQRILFGDYSVVWTVHEQVLSTVRNGGHLTKKIFFPNGTNLRLTEEIAFKYWAPLFATIKDKRPVIIEMVGRFLLNLASYTTLEISRFMVSASMNEEELAAFTALLFLRPEILSAVSPESRTILSQRRHQLLHNLSNYLISTGQKVDERMSKIILLISEMQV
uniref:NR LBD domain-containing protein n=1 Tax=Panagrolaimus superbus TaxID=310955 RepID=A0A914YVN3_9BILA